MSTCAACGAELHCAMADGGDDPCWCTAYAPVMAVPDAASDARCLCPACLQQRIDAAQGDA